jgi:hypothetical protein
MKIKNQSDFIKADENHSLSRLSADEIVITYIDDIWDGPLSGSCDWNNKQYYFYSFDQLEDDGSGDRWPRKYLLIDIKPEQLKDTLQIRETYRKLKTGEMSKEEYAEFLKNIPAQVVEPQQVVGWFDSAPKEKNEPTKFMKSYLDLQNYS